MPGRTIFTISWELPMPDVIGRYQITGELGKGGMGVVYRALDPRLGKLVAVKLLSESGIPAGDSYARFRREARAAAILNHPSIVAVYDFDEDRGVPFLVCEFVEGKTLGEWIASGPMTEKMILEVGVQVSSGLAYAHQRGILHRDIKPNNIILTREGTAKILDFGLAKRTGAEFIGPDGSVLDEVSIATEVGVIVGTVQYMSPEQITGGDIDGRSDVFSLGIVLYEMAAGINPFLGRNHASTIGRILSLDPFPVSRSLQGISPALTAIISRCLQKNREDRYPGVAILQAELEKLLHPMVPSTTERQGLSRAQAEETPIPRQMARASLILLQAMYLSIYSVALYHFYDVCLKICRAMGLAALAGGFIPRWVSAGVLFSAWCGIAVRLYLLAALGFDHPQTGIKSQRLFPLLFLLDILWSMSPFLLLEKWPAGIVLICVALMAYLPISHRNLIHAAYPPFR
jgi:predicted Ser/Thr protein kinase